MLESLCQGKPSLDKFVPAEIGRLRDLGGGAWEKWEVFQSGEGQAVDDLMGGGEAGPELGSSTHASS